MNLKDALKDLKNSVSSTYDRSVDAVLDRLGLEPKRSTMDVVLPALGIFGAGIAVGATLGVLFAPKRGEEIRSDIAHRVEDLREKGSESYEQLKTKGEDAIGGVREKSPKGDKQSTKKQA